MSLRLKIILIMLLVSLIFWAGLYHLRAKLSLTEIIASPIDLTLTVGVIGVAIIYLAAYIVALLFKRTRPM